MSIREQINIYKDSIVGTRDYQEDSADYVIKDGRCLAVLCDGMGGLNGGEVASGFAVKEITDRYGGTEKIEDCPEFLYKCAVDIDRAVYDLKDEKGERLHAGTTMVAAIIDGDELYWLSVGDSRIYLIRGDEVTVANEEHNYETRLNRMLKSGQITPENYQQEMKRGAALTSYIGIGNVYMMDINDSPYMLQDGDIIVLSSDGMFRRIDNELLLEIIKANKNNLQKAAEELTATALKKASGSQDNTTVEIISFKK